MKPAKKPFVVEIKNRRNTSKKPTSIWGNIDLKAASGQLEDFEPVDHDVSGTDTGLMDAQSEARLNVPD